MPTIDQPTADGIIPDIGGNGGNEPVDPNVIDPANIDPPKRGRGRPPAANGSRDRKPKSDGRAAKPAPAPRKASGSPALNVDGLSFFLGIASNLMAGKLKQDALALDDEESRAIASAAANVAAQYNVELDPKAAAWMGLAMTIGGIYGMKIATIKLNKAMAG